MSLKRQVVDFLALAHGSTGARAAVVTGAVALGVLSASPASAIVHCDDGDSHQAHLDRHVHCIS